MSSEDLRAALESYSKVASECRLPKMRLSRCEISSQFFTSLDQVWPILGGVSAPSGWLGFQSGNVPLDGSAPAAEEAALGALMDAELAAQEKSVHVRYRGDGWVLTTYTPGVGEEFLSEQISLLTANGALTYERLWSADPQLGMRQAHARLIAKEVAR